MYQAKTVLNQLSKVEIVFAMQHYTEPEVLFQGKKTKTKSFSKFVAAQANKVSNKEKFTKQTDVTNDVLSARENCVGYHQLQIR